MAEIPITPPEADPQEAIAEVLIALGDGEPTAEQLAFLNAEADRIEGGVIVWSTDARGRAEHRIPADKYYQARPATEVHNIDTPEFNLNPPVGGRAPGSRPDPKGERISIKGAKITGAGSIIPATREGVTRFAVEHTYNYIDPETGESTRLDETLAKTLLEFSTFNRRLQSSVRSSAGAAAPLHRRLRSNNDLPDAGPTHIDDESYQLVEEYVHTCSRMSPEYLETKGFNKREAAAIFARLQADEVVDSEYTPGEGFTVPPRPKETPGTRFEHRRRVDAIRNTLGGIIMLDETSLAPVTAVDIMPPKAPEAPKVEKEAYLLAEPYWADMVLFVAKTQPGSDSKIMISSSALAGRLGAKYKMDKMAAEQVAADLYSKFTKDGVMRPITSHEDRGRNSIESVHKYQIMKSTDEITSLYGIDPEKEEMERRIVGRYLTTRLTKERVKEIDDIIGEAIQNYHATLPPTAGLSVRELLEYEVRKEDGEKAIRRDYVHSLLIAEFGDTIPEGLEDKIIDRLEGRATEINRKRGDKKRHQRNTSSS